MLPKQLFWERLQPIKKLKAGEQLVLIGNADLVKLILIEEGFNVNHFEFVHTEEVVGMGEHPNKSHRSETKF